MRRVAVAIAVSAAAAPLGCGAPRELGGSEERAAVLEGTPPAIGAGPRFHPPSLSEAVRAGAPVGALRCTAGAGPRFGAHLEVFAAGQVLIVPAGIGVAPPRRVNGAYIRGGRCSYPVRTREPTGVIEVAPGRTVTLGQLFDLWGQPLSRRAVAGWRTVEGAAVHAFVGGRAWRGDPRAIPLTRHAQIVLEVGRFVAPHARYVFPPGL